MKPMDSHPLDRGLRGAALCAIVLGVTTMCAAPTEILVDVYTEVDCAKDPTTAVVVGPTLVSLQTSAVTSTLSSCAPRTQRSGRVVLSPAGERDASIAFQIVTRDDGEDPERSCTASSSAGCIVARRQLRFVPGASTRVDVALRLSCLGVTCPIEETCRNGACEAAAVPDGCLGGVCPDSLPEPGSADAGTAADASTPPLRDASSPDGGGPSSTLPEVVDVPTLVYASDDPSYQVRGLAASPGGLVWVETRSSDPAPRYQKASWDSMTTPTTATLPADAGVGISVDENGDQLTIGRSGPTHCADVLGVGSVTCSGAFLTNGGVAHMGGQTYLVGAQSVSPAVGWFGAGPTVSGVCTLPSLLVPRYAEARGGFLFVALGAAVGRITLPLTGGQPCMTPIFVLSDLVNGRGVAVSNESDIVCGGDDGAIVCAFAALGNQRVRFAETKRPTEDLAMRALDARRFVYYAAGHEIWVVRIL